MALGGGRAAVTDQVDHAVGIADLIKIGEPVSPGTLLCTLHINDEAKGVRADLSAIASAKAEALIREAIKFTPTAPAPELLAQDLIQ